MPFLSVITMGVVLLAGTKSMAPWTVQVSPVPSRATVSVGLAVGASAVVVKVHALLSVMPGSAVPAVSMKTPLSTVTAYVPPKGSGA